MVEDNKRTEDHSVFLKKGFGNRDKNHTDSIYQLLWDTPLILSVGYYTLKEH